MEKAIQHQAANLSFWDNYAGWYRQWITHGTYHAKILRFVASLVKPKWRILHIGAGNGGLSLPLERMGCEVTALEPSQGMRALLTQEMVEQGSGRILIDNRPWEDVPPEGYSDYDLMVACNSLHLTPMGFVLPWTRCFGPEQNGSLS